MWKALIKWSQYFYNITLVLDEKTVIFNDYKGNQAKFVNMLLLTMKQYIYATKCKGEKLIFTSYLNVLDHWYNMEKILAWDIHRMIPFNTKWKV